MLSVMCWDIIHHVSLKVIFSGDRQRFFTLTIVKIKNKYFTNTGIKLKQLIDSGLIGSVVHIGNYDDEKNYFE